MFCEVGVYEFSRAYFRENFLESYLSLAKDPVYSIKLEFIRSLYKIKAFIDYDVDMNVRIHDILSDLRFDKNKDIVEATEQLDVALL